MGVILAGVLVAAAVLSGCGLEHRPGALGEPSQTPSQSATPSSRFTKSQVGGTPGVYNWQPADLGNGVVGFVPRDAGWVIAQETQNDYGGSNYLYRRQQGTVDVFQASLIDATKVGVAALCQQVLAQVTARMVQVSAQPNLDYPALSDEVVGTTGCQASGLVSEDQRAIILRADLAERLADGACYAQVVYLPKTPVDANATAIANEMAKGMLAQAVAHLHDKAQG